jgi:hypothetical protein
MEMLLEPALPTESNIIQKIPLVKGSGKFMVSPGVAG